ncbi:MAG: hypothetical protein ACKV2T_38995 [Kofleriaceae bacterium]
MRVLVALAVLPVATAHADTLPWHVELGLRGTASLAVGDEAVSRSGVVPSLTIRTQRSFGGLFVGANLAAGLPAYAGQHEASLSVGHAWTLREGDCRRGPLDPDSDDGTFGDLDCDAQVDFLGGVDAGVVLLHFDAPPELSATDDALLYWGPLARARAAVRATWSTPAGKQLGVTAGLNLAVTSAHYMTTATGTGLRLEPSLDVAAAIGF